MFLWGERCSSGLSVFDNDTYPLNILNMCGITEEKLTLKLFVAWNIKTILQLMTWFWTSPFTCFSCHGQRAVPHLEYWMWCILFVAGRELQWDLASPGPDRWPRFSQVSQCSQKLARWAASRWASLPCSSMISFTVTCGRMGLHHFLGHGFNRSINLFSGVYFCVFCRHYFSKCKNCLYMKIFNSFHISDQCVVARQILDLLNGLKM